jgi:HSP20 family molecular chaperone IbpA
MSVFTNAVDELLRLQGELDSRLHPGSESSSPSAANVYPPVNVFRDPNSNVVIRASRPDSTRGITVTCEQRRHAAASARGRRRERLPPARAAVWQFSRSIQLPVDLDIDHAEAKFNQGVMTLASRRLRPPSPPNQRPTAARPRR